MWNTSDFLALVEESRLTRAQSSFPKSESLRSSLHGAPLLFISLNDGGSVGEPFGFYLSLQEDRGWMDIPADSADNWKDKGYELAPQTCKVWKNISFRFKKIKTANSSYRSEK